MSEVWTKDTTVNIELGESQGKQDFFEALAQRYEARLARISANTKINIGTPRGIRTTAYYIGAAAFVRGLKG